MEQNTLEVMDDLHHRISQRFQEGRYYEAIPLAERFRDLAGQYFGKSHPDFAVSSEMLANAYLKVGRFTDAEPLYHDALRTFRAAFGNIHPFCASSLNDLATLCQNVGKLDDAEKLFQEALEIRRKTVGENHLDFSVNLNNLALLYKDMGNYAAAQRLFLQALEIQVQVVGNRDPVYATTLNNFALLCLAMGNYAAAEPLFLRASEIDLRTLGNDHPSYALDLHNLADLYQATGNYTAAEPLYQQALEIKRQASGESHPDFARSLSGLALLYKAQGAYGQAEPLLQQTLTIREEMLGPTHQDTAASLIHLALLYAATEREVTAFSLMERAATIDDRMLGQIFAVSSEQQRLTYLLTVMGSVYEFLSLVFQSPWTSPRAIQVALDLVLRRKAIGMEALAMQRDAVLGGQYPDVEQKLQELTKWKQQIAQKILAGASPEGPEGLECLEAHLQQLDDWNAHKERLEAELARQIPEMNLERKLREADRQAVAQAMLPGVVLVEIVQFHPFNFTAVPARGEQQWQPARYLAFVVPGGEPDKVQMVDLGEAGLIDRLIEAFRQAIIDEAKALDRGGVDRVGGPQRRRLPTGSSSEEGQKLRGAVFDQLREALGGCKRLLLAPDGDLTHLPFEVLPLEDGRRLLDEYQISYLSTGRDVLRFGAEASGQTTTPIVAADPDFDLAADSPASPMSRTDSVDRTSRFTIGRQSQDLDRADQHFIRLPGTRIEGERVAALLGVKAWLDGRALEARLKACRSPRVVHLATHGFFLPNTRGQLQTMEQWEVLARMGTNRMMGPGMESPMLRSGIALAGANSWFKRRRLPPEAEDGLVTAEDVAGLNFLHTELVVLSACETGLGEVLTGEGVFGLRRAFIIAGAKTLVMSLWRVPDLSTAILMERLYHKLLSAGMRRDDALRAAQHDVRTITIGELKTDWLSPAMIERQATLDPQVRPALEELARQPDNERPFSHPYYWGAFICQGDTAALP